MTRYSIVVKLTPDAAGEAPSAMRVVGAKGGQVFHYGPAAGAAGCFQARLYHASVLPESGHTVDSSLVYSGWKPAERAGSSAKTLVFIVSPNRR